MYNAQVLDCQRLFEMKYTICGYYAIKFQRFYRSISFLGKPLLNLFTLVKYNYYRHSGAQDMGYANSLGLVGQSS